MAEQIIQKYEATPDADGSIGDLASTEYRIAQSFTISNSYNISAIAMSLLGLTGTPSGNITVRIETDNGAGEGTSVPTGSLADANLTISTYNPRVAGWGKISFATPAILGSGKYWIVLGCSNQSNNNAWQFDLDNTGSTYTGGHGVYNTNGGAWHVYAGDFNFRVYALINNAIFFGCNF